MTSLAGLSFGIALGTGSDGCAANTPSNRTIPPHSAPSAALDLPENPSDQEIKRVRFFSEPLLPTEAAPSTEQNRELAKAIRRHSQRVVDDDFSALEDFVAKHPESSWTPSLEFNLGLEFYNTGWYSKALAAYEKTWAAFAHTSEPALKSLADRAVGELAFMYARLGRMKELSDLLASLEGRPLVGPATERIAGAKQGLWTMQNRPGVAFRCGPLALDRIRASLDPLSAGDELIQAAQSTTNGFSLNQVANLSERLGMDCQMAYRSNGAPFLVPAVVHWKVGHYAALVRKDEGRYLLQDPTFGNSTWVTRRALENQTSGYFLVPTGHLPSGWRAVNEAEGTSIWGKGSTSQSDSASNTPQDPTMPADGACQGMAVHRTHLMLVSLNIQDFPVGYAPSVGPSVNFVVTYNQREAGQPASFSYSNLGPKWTFNLLAYIVDTPSNTLADVSYFTVGGGSLPFTGFTTNSQTFAPQIKSQALLKRTSVNSYEMLLPDGSKYVFDQPDSVGGTSRRVFMTRILDPQGNYVQISYDGSFRVIAITDAIGQVTVISYDNQSDSLKITKVTDPFGRYATFSYDASNRLVQITDSIGLVSQFSYDSGNFIQSLTTPYGVTSFAYGESGRSRWLEATYPTGEKERTEYSESPNVGIPMQEPANTVPAGMQAVDTYLIYRNTFYWDRKAYPFYAAATNDYTKARVYHWLHSTDIQSSMGVLESVRMPLENRVWFNYSGQPQPYIIGSSSLPSAIGRVLDDGTTQLRTFQYNPLGHIANSVDPVGRSMTYLYSTNLVDLLEVRQTTAGNNDLVGKFIYNSQHEPIAVWDAAGQMTTNTFSARGQLLTTTNPKNETTTFNYDTNGYLLEVDGPLAGTNDMVNFTYDLLGRVHSATGPDGYSLMYGFDNLDRLTNITYPDATFEAFTYTNLDRVKFRDRMGRETLYGYDSLRRLTSTQDPLNRITRFEYCGCGSLSGLIDPMSRKTHWDHDVQGRMRAKEYTDGSSILYTYESTTSRLKSVQDEKGQLKIYDYNLDDNLKRISYPNAQIATPTVAFAYDPRYNRMTSMQDGIGTTAWTYYPTGVLGALRMASVDGPWNNDTVTYQYDSLQRATNRAINGVAQSYAYDPLGRTTNVLNALGNFRYAYDGATARPLDTFYPNGQTTHYDYFDNLGDHRLQRITHNKPDMSLISRFTYAYNAFGNITNWIQEMGVLTETWSIGYDNADQLLSVSDDQGGTNTIAYAYNYDPAGNRLFEDVNGARRNFSYNALNELVSSSNTNSTNTSYEWDAEQRLAAINQGTNRSEFSYDGLGRRLRIVEKQNGVTQTQDRFVWCGSEICEERNFADVVTNRFYRLGEQQGTMNLYCSRDHLGSVRGMNDQFANVRSTYTYNPYGEKTKLQGDLDSHFGFTEHLQHSITGMLLTRYRVYSSANARWQSRDLLSEVKSPNLYNYVNNDPINRTDPLGLGQVTIGGGAGWGGILTVGYNGGQLSIGVYAGAGEGFFFDIDDSDTGSKACGVVGGIKARGAFGPFSGDSEYKFNGEPSWNLGLNVPNQPGSSLGYGSEGYKPGGGFDFGEGFGGAIGIGGTLYFPKGSDTLRYGSLGHGSRSDTP